MTTFALLIVTAAGPSILLNGDFEAGLEGWPHTNAWYAKPAGAGVSEALAAPGEGRGGGAAVKLVGGGLRGIMLQSRPAYPGRYRVRGWARCEGLGEARGGILIEWMGPDGWMAGEQVLTIGGDSDWTAVDTIVTAPPRTRAVHFDLLTLTPNDGTIWFDEVSMERLPSNLPPPPRPVLQAATPDGEEGCLAVTWQPELADTATFVLIYADDGELPVAVADAAAPPALLRSLANGREYRLRASASNGDGGVSPMGEPIAATPADRQPPRPGWVRAVRLGGQTLAGWRPHLLDRDVVRVGIIAPGRDAPLAVEAVDSRDDRFHLVQPVETDAARIGFWCVDDAGNRSEVVWAEVEAIQLGGEAGPWTAWLTGPHEQLPRDAAAPDAPVEAIALLALRGQTVGCQLMIRPEADLHDAWLLADEAAGLTFDYRFVDYFAIERNSRATPAEELVWPGPSEYPEELADEPVRDLPAGRLQPVYLRFEVPRDTPPGPRQVTVRLVTGEGQETYTVTVDVAAVTLPEQTRLKFVYWFEWGEPCREFGVEPESEDGWRALLRLGELMRRYHQNVVMVPWSLVDLWRRPDGTLAADFRRFDRYLETFQQAGVEQLFCLSHFGGRTTGDWLCPTFSAAGATARSLPDGAPVDLSALDLLPLLQDHIEALGLLDRFTVHVADEPIGENRDSWLELSAEVHRRAPKLRRIDAIHIPQLEGGLEVWVPQLNYLDQWRDEYAAVQAAGNDVWFYVAWVPQAGFPNRMIDSHAIKPRLLHWMHYLYGTTGYLHWALNRWSIDPFGLGSPGDTTIVWGSQRQIADSSLRYEAERAGIEDLELMYLAQEALEARGLTRAEATARVRETIAPAAEQAQRFTRDWATVEAVRRALVELAAG